jgi:putative ABC transport system permease protein
MKRIPGLRSFFRLPASTERVSSDVEHEIAFHLEERTQRLVDAGMNRADARAQAMREFGDVEDARMELEAIGRRHVRRANWSDWWGDLGRDARYTLRTLLRAPGFTAIAVLTLALGIGATTAIYTVVDAVLLRPFSVAEPERLVVIYESPDDAANRQKNSFAPANFFDLEAQSKSFSSMSYFLLSPENLTGAGAPQRVQVQYVSANFFTTIGVQPVLGRAFHAEEDDEGQGNVVVLSHELWRTRFGSDPNVLGRTVRVDDKPREIVGVMGQGFTVLDRKPDLWMPLPLERGNRTTMGRFLDSLGRLKPGVTMEQASADLASISRTLERDYPAFNAGLSATLVPLREEVLGEVRPALLMLLGAVGMLLLIACTNVANLLLSRASARRNEMVVRLSLGATRGRLIRQLLTESVGLSLVGGVLGVGMAALATRALVRSLPNTVQLPRVEAAALDGRVLAFALLVTLLTGVLFGLAPALAASRADLQTALRDATRGSTSGRNAIRLRNSLVVAEVALALVLLVGAGLLMRSLQKLHAVDTGMRAEGVLTLQVGLGEEDYGKPDALRAFLPRLLSELNGLPGVESVGTIWFLPFTGDRSTTSSWRPDRPKPADGQEPSADIRVVGGDYFAAQGIRLLRGRAFDERDAATSGITFVVNEAFARDQFPGEDPVGKRAGYHWDEVIVGEIIGVVADTRDRGVTEPPAPAIYRAFAQEPSSRLNVVVRTAGDPIALAGAARDRIRRLDPNLPLANVRSMEAVVSEATARSRLSSYLLTAFAAFALLLAGIGLYGIISYGVAQRRGEIAVRVALGANRSDILRLILSQGMVLTLAGLALGLIGAFVFTRLIQSMLFGVTTADPATFAVVPLVLVAVALLASYLPARRAARVQPAAALRS